MRLRRAVQTYLAGLSYFFSLWPEALQRELARLACAHILARHEVALTRGRPPDRIYFILKGKVRSAAAAGLWHARTRALVGNRTSPHLGACAVPLRTCVQVSCAGVDVRLCVCPVCPHLHCLQLDVRLPMPSANGGREETTLAVLGRGHTVGEAVLLVSRCGWLGGAHRCC